MMKNLSIGGAALLVGALLGTVRGLADEKPPPGCTDVPNGPTVCRDDSSVSVGGKTDDKGIREFFEYPLGKSPHSVPQDIGRGVEHAGQEIGKIGLRIFGR